MTELSINRPSGWAFLKEASGNLASKIKDSTVHLPFLRHRTTSHSPLRPSPSPTRPRHEQSASPSRKPGMPRNVYPSETTRGVELLPSGHALRTSASAHNVAHVATPTDRHRTVSSPSPGPHHPPHSTLVAPAIDIPELPPNDTGIVDISQGTVSSVASSSQSAWLHTHVSASTFTEMPTCMDPQASSTLGQPTAGSEPVSVCQADKAHSLARPGSSQASNLRIHYDFRPLPDYSESQCENAQLEWLSYILRQTEEEARNSRETLLVAHERKRFIAARLRLLEQFCPEDILDPITYLVVEDDSKSIPAQDVNSPQ